MLLTITTTHSLATDLGYLLAKHPDKCQSFDLSFGQAHVFYPEYTAPEHLDRLRHRGLGAKRSLALREFALGVESLERFVRREPLRRVHECVFGVLAMESEPVDPRL